ncbi:MAG: VOC family protein [Dehalococcoidia bacterium]
MKNPVMHFEILAKPGGKAALQEFYRKTFDWEIQPAGPMEYGMLPAPEGGPGIGGAVDEAEHADDARVVVFIEVDDPQAYLDRALANGGTLVREVMVIPGMVTMAQFADPAGNQVGIIGAEVPPEA